VATHADRFSDIVTSDCRILYFCTERRAIHLGKDPRSIERMTPDGVQRSLGVPVQHVPTYLALTEGRKHGLASSDGAQPTLTTRDARRLVELHGALPGIYQHLSTMKSPALRKKLADNQKAFEERYSDNTTSPPEASAGLPSRRCKSAGVEARVRRTRRPAPILRWFWEFEHGETEHRTSTCLSMATAVLSVGREDANRHASCRADELTISASIRLGIYSMHEMKPARFSGSSPSGPDRWRRR
jgi:hypothetical protein